MIVHFCRMCEIEKKQEQGETNKQKGNDEKECDHYVQYSTVQYRRPS